MDIEIGIVGKPKKWVLNQSRIRIGRDPKCEVNLPGKQFPTVTGEHLVLDVALGMVRVSSLSDSSSETYLNDRLASPGTVVRSGDVVRLGAGGPELNIRLLEPEGEQSSGYEPTRVITPEPRDFAGPGATTVSPAPFPSVASPRKHGYGTDQTPIPPVRPASSAPSAGPRWADFGPGAGGASTGAGSGRGPETSIMPGVDRGPATTIMSSPIAPGPSRGPVTGLGLGLGAGTNSGTGTGADIVNSREMEGKLRIVQVILAVNVVLLIGLFAWLFQINRQLGETRDELKQMHTEAQDAMKDVTPQLDARMGVFERRMDSMDTKMQAAEDHMVNRMNTEIPAMLDKYIDKKLAEKMGKP